jgi:hypothetical protein
VKGMPRWLALGWRSLWLAMACLVWLALLGGEPAAAQSMESALAPGPVSQVHVKAEHDCRSCHVPFDRAAQDGRCLECHKEVAADVRRKLGFHGKKLAQTPQTCRSCHTEHRGRDANLAPLDRKAFDHRLTNYPLVDKHSKVDCEKCHRPTQVPSKRWREAPQACMACHLKDDVHKGGLGKKCEDCHNVKGWREAGFDHDKQTKFALTGKHAPPLKCDACHADGRFKDTPRTCVGCHQKDDETKGHKGHYGSKCESCHTSSAWKPSSFKHERDTRYALKDKHQQAKCVACHTAPLHGPKLPTACVACHSKDDKHEGTLGRVCESCHTERGWKDSPAFDHSKSNFPLLGGHASSKVQCKDCHRDTRFRQTPSDCIACHRKDDQHEATLGTACADCHNETSWKKLAPGRFDHARTAFPLRQAHAAPALQCVSCHRDLKSFRNTAKDCIACHRKDDKHEGTLGTACVTCHDEASWKKLAPGRFDHQRTAFPLRGAHQSPPLQCVACHRDHKSYKGIGKACIACHRKDDAHEGRYGANCQACHSEQNWRSARFDHRGTRFTLTGAHQVVQCESCHRNPSSSVPISQRFKGAPLDCYACHRKDDKHKASLGARCETCHNDRAWTLWSFDHDRATRYPLQGRHRRISCESCHVSPAPAGQAVAPLATECLACHRKDDAHEGHFGRRCESCHSRDAWKPAMKKPP